MPSTLIECAAINDDRAATVADLRDRMFGSLPCRPGSRRASVVGVITRSGHAIGRRVGPPSPPFVVKLPPKPPPPGAPSPPCPCNPADRCRHLTGRRLCLWLATSIVLVISSVVSDSDHEWARARRRARSSDTSTDVRRRPRTPHRSAATARCSRSIQDRCCSIVSRRDRERAGRRAAGQTTYVPVPKQGSIRIPIPSPIPSPIPIPIPIPIPVGSRSGSTVISRSHGPG